MTKQITQWQVLDCKDSERWSRGDGKVLINGYIDRNCFSYIECEYTMITDKTSQMQKIVQQHGYMWMLRMGNSHLNPFWAVSDTEMFGQVY